MPRPKIHLTCCLCGKTIAQRGSAYSLDAEWQRRHPDMVGTLACRCALREEWTCEGTPGRYVAGHIPVPRSEAPPCMDSLSHIGQEHTPVSAVVTHPLAALNQGAEEYLRHTARRRGIDADVARQLQRVLAEWDARPPRTNDRL